jgi:uroporphyrinogen decarboxylase
MNGRDLLLKALRGETTPRPAWLPFVGVHGGKLLGLNAKDYLRSSLNIYRAIKESILLYHPDGIPIVFDLQIEAEILGCELRWADEVPPSVVTHPLAKKSLSELPKFSTDAGRFPLVLETLRAVKKDFGKELALYGLITGPFTLASHLFGSAIFVEMFDNEDKVKEVMAFCAEVGKRSAEAYLAHGADVAAVVDPMTSQIAPKHFDQFVAPYLNAVFDHIRAKGGLSSLFVCGDASRNLEKMCQTTCDNLSVDENISLERLRDLARANRKSFGGNLKLTSVLLLGSADDSKLDAIRCLDIGGNTGFILAPGCDLPYATPPSNLEAVAQMVLDPYQREVARTTIKASTADLTAGVRLPDYAHEKRVIVDVVTLDSSACAPCQYMVDAAQKAVVRFGAKVVVREHKIKTHEGIGVMCKLGVKNIPAICIDGDPTFISIIPDQTTLAAAVEAKLKAKGL